MMGLFIFALIACACWFALKPPASPKLAYIPAAVVWHEGQYAAQINGL